MHIDERPTNIPEKHVEFSKAVARLAKEHGIQNMNVTYRPSYFGGDWQGDIAIYWEQGRHGADAGKVRISSTETIHVSTTVKP